MAIGSASNTASSLRAPPPRITTTASSGRRASSSIAAATIATACSPCTRTSHTDSWKPMPLASSSCSKSCQAALPTLVTTPMRNGDAARAGGARLASTSPPATSRRITWSRCWARSPSVKRGSMPLIFSVEPAGRGVEVEVAVDAHLHAVAEHEVDDARASRRSRSRLRREERHRGSTALASDCVVGEREVGVRARARSTPGSRRGPRHRRRAAAQAGLITSASSPTVYVPSGWSRSASSSTPVPKSSCGWDMTGEVLRDRRPGRYPSAVSDRGR